MSTVNAIVQQNSSKAVYGADPTAAAGFSPTPYKQPNSYNMDFSVPFLYLVGGGLLLWYIAFRK